MIERGRVRLPAPDQIAFVVKDRDKTMSFYSSTFGIGPWRVAELEYPEIIVRGQKSAYRVGLASVPWGYADLCLVQPLSGKSLYSEFLEEGKEGLHHLAFDLTKEGKEQALADLKEVGIEVIQGAVSRFGTGSSFAYLDTDKTGGAIVELRYRPSKNPPHFYKLVPMDAGAEAAEVKLPPPCQIGLVVRDLKKIVEFYSTAFGLGPWRELEYQHSSVGGRGRQSFYTLKTASADLGEGYELELAQPLTGRSLYSEFLDQGREGFHHLTFDIDKDQMKQAVAALARKGIEIIHEALCAPGGERFAYLNTDKVGGTLFKLRCGS
jgi:catechol 2,3-dioxygenase-like lactoylglutathione lyase family enzyme